MRVYLSSPHRYPGWRYGVASSAVHDRLARGLAELGHEVRYHLRDANGAKLPDGVVAVSCAKGDEDILHINHIDVATTPKTKRPWVRSIHSDLLDQGMPRENTKPNFIYISQTMARLHKSDRFVLNGIDPAEFIYSETKNNCFLFVVSGGIEKARSKKGLDTAFWIAKETGIKLVVAGGDGDPPGDAAFGDLCRANGAVFLGTIHGKRKAEVFTAAKALLFPTKHNEAFGLPVVEALMSGTPVIASTQGAMTELIDPAGGFACARESAYLDAVANLGRIKPADCRRLALERFHYLDMTRNYLREYEREIRNVTSGVH
jgi:glycosyltransferase involved in cell wall biosynthesis